MSGRDRKVMFGLTGVFFLLWVLAPAAAAANAGNPNLAVNAQVKASSKMAVYTPDKAVDGKLDTRWVNNAGDKEPWIEITLAGGPQTVAAVRLFADLRPGYVPSAWRIENRSPGAAKRVLFEMKDNKSSAVLCKFKPVEASRLTVVFPKGSTRDNMNRIHEIEIYASPESLPALSDQYGSSGPRKEGFEALDAVEHATLMSPRGIYSALRENEAYTVYAEAFPGEDWGEKINNAVSAVRMRADGGEVVLPPGTLEVSTTISLGGNITKTSGAPMGVILRGAGGASTTRISWNGPPKQAIIDMPAPWWCQVKNLQVNGNNVAGVIGIRYRDGLERGRNGGKLDSIENIEIRKCDVGLEVGSIFGPDLVSSSFRNIFITQVRIGVRVLGSNVAIQQFYNICITDFKEAGFKLMGFSGRLVRSRKEKDTPTDEKVLRTPDGEEVFMEDIPEYGRKHRVHYSTHTDVPGSKAKPWVGGGYPEIIIYGLSVHSSTPNAWVIDTNWAPVRIYSARCEGMGGLLRVTRGLPNMRHNIVLMDVSATAVGNEKGNVIEFDGPGPLYLIGCSLNGNVAVADTEVFSIGTHFYFYDFRQRYPYQVVDAGIVPLRPGHVPRVHQAHNLSHLDVTVPAGAKSVRVPLGGGTVQQDGNYHVLPTMTWNAGNHWVTEASRDSFTLNFVRAPEADALVRILLTRRPFQQSPARQAAVQAAK